VVLEVPGVLPEVLKVVLVALVMVAGSFTGCPGGVEVASRSLAGGSGLVLVPSRMVLVA
jgi:hypothetical protein